MTSELAFEVWGKQGKGSLGKGEVSTGSLVSECMSLGSVEVLDGCRRGD